MRGYAIAIVENTLPEIEPRFKDTVQRTVTQYDDKLPCLQTCCGTSLWAQNRD